MRTPPATQDRGIRSIFTSAMGIEEKPASRWDRVLRSFDAELMRHVAVGAVSGAVLSVAGFGLLIAAKPKSAAAEAGPTRHLALSDAPKADRMAVPGGKLAAVATAAAFTERPAGDISIGSPARLLTTDEPLSYADQPKVNAAVGAIDRTLALPGTLDPVENQPARIVTASLGEPSITPPMAADGAPVAVGEDDDDGNIIPVPRARPAPPPLALPLPRPRPNMPMITVAPPAGDDAAPVTQASAPAPSETPPGLRPGAGQILGFFSSPTEPVKAPSRTTTIDTPFGVPYVLQQGSIETACLKPELVDILRKIETHYHQKVVITSGFRDRGRQGSLHRQCAAVDIEVPGVDAASLASYSRSIPDIGGVGTYCHPHMIHVDIGTPRDWKYGCGSFFAMRGGAPGKWGKVPGNLARASTPAGPTNAAEAAQED